MSTIPINSTGRSKPTRVSSGLYFMNIDGADFGGTSIRVDWAKSCDAADEDWSPLLDESGEPTAISSAFNKQVTLGIGAVSFVATGGSPNVEAFVGRL